MLSSPKCVFLSCGTGVLSPWHAFTCIHVVPIVVRLKMWNNSPQNISPYLLCSHLVYGAT